MSSAVELSEALATAPAERARGRVIAEAFERLEERYPHLPDLVTHGHLRETELRLTKEIEQVRADLTIRHGLARVDERRRSRASSVSIFHAEAHRFQRASNGRAARNGLRLPQQLGLTLDAL